MLAAVIWPLIVYIYSFIGLKFKLLWFLWFHIAKAKFDVSLFHTHTLVMNENAKIQD